MRRQLFENGLVVALASAALGGCEAPATPPPFDGGVFNPGDGGAAFPQDTTRDVHVGPMVWANYSPQEVSFMATEPTIDFVASLGTDLGEAGQDAVSFRSQSTKPSMWFRCAINVRSPNNFLGFWEDEWTVLKAQSSWFLPGPLGAHVRADWNTFLMNPASAEWQGYVAGRALHELQRGVWTGIRLDVVYEQLDGWTKNGLPSGYKREGFQQDMLSFLRAVKAAAGPAPVQMNGMWPSYDGTLEHYRAEMAILDGAEIEQFAAHQNRTYQPFTLWKKQVSTMMWNERQVPFKYTQAYGWTGQEDVPKRIYILASYLLGKGQHSYIYYMDDEWAGLYFFPEWRIRIGAAVQTSYCDSCLAAVDAYYDASLNLYQREFENGFVLVNPSDSPSGSRTFASPVHLVIPTGSRVPELGGSGRLEYSVATSVTLQPKSAAIALRSLP